MHPAVIEPRRRVDRAWDHFEALDKVVTAYFNRDPHLILRYEDPENGDEVWEAWVREPIPIELPTLIGDCVHNLRAALENAAWNFALTKKAKPRNDTAFVICHSATDFQGKSAKIQDLPTAARNVIKELQPYKRTPNDPRADPLWILERLWNDDKHRAPHVVTGVLGGSALNIVEMSGVSGFSDGVNYGPFEDGDEIARLKINGRTPESTVNVEAEFAFGIAFDKTGPGRGAYVDHLLRGLHHYVRDEVFGQLEDLSVENGS
jgi:hypothetical protein